MPAEVHEITVNAVWDAESCIATLEGKNIIISREAPTVKGAILAVVEAWEVA